MSWQERYAWKIAHEVVPMPTNDEQTAGHLMKHHGFTKEEVMKAMHLVKDSNTTITEDHKMDHSMFDGYFGKHDSPDFKHEPNGLWDDHLHEG